MNYICDNMHRNERGGVTLILVVWVIVVLIAIVGEFSYSMRTEMNITINFKEEEEAYQLALAGLEQAKMEILSTSEPNYVYLNENEMIMFGDPVSTDDEVEEPVRNSELGKGSFTYELIDEDSKLNINIATPEQLRKVFTDSGVDDSEVDEIVDSIIDWRDENDLHQLNGAEEDYYQSLDEPYSSKDGPFDFVEELLLVRGMSKEILYGFEAEEDGISYDGVAQHLTVRGSDIVNINTATSVVLDSVFGAADTDNILIQREAGPITMPMNKGKVTSVYFTVISTGISADGKIKRAVKAVVEKSNDTVRTLYWNDNYAG